jgi:asparaginyl-tRNA synthetase
MERSVIKEVIEQGQAGKDVAVAGWVKSIRTSKSMAFMHLNDGSTFDSIQVLIPEALPNRDEVLRQITGASMRVEGRLRPSPAKGQSLEIEPSRIEVLGPCDADCPVQKAGASYEFLRGVAHMRPRTNTFGAVFRVRSELSYAVHEFFHRGGFVLCHSPILTTSDCEGAGAMFQVTTLDLDKPPRGGGGGGGGGIDYSKDFFGEKCSLTVSGQLEAEILALSLGKVYTFGPTFRAEPSTTPRHASEFWMIEPEIAFADLSCAADLAEELVRYLIDDLLSRRPDDMAFLDRHIDPGVVDRLKHVLATPFRRLDYTEAVEILERSSRSFEFPVRWGVDLQSEHERHLTEEVFSQPLVVMNYPKGIKAFYMRLNDDDRTVAAMDVLVPKIGEIIGGSQREERLDVLDRRIVEMGLRVEDYGWYRDLRRFGTVPHAGFGLGLERLLQFCTGMANIRDVIPYPRAPRQIDF